MKFREGFTQVTQSKSRTFFVFCFCFLAGIACGSLNEKQIGSLYFISILVVLLCVVYLWKHSSAVRIAAFSILFFIVGLFRYSAVFPSNNSHFIHTYVDTEVHVLGFVSAEPDIRQDGIRYRVRVKKFLDSEQHVQGELYMKSGLYPRFSYGDELAVNCTIQQPEPIEDVETGMVFRYDRYLSRINVYAVCSQPLIESTGVVMGSIFYRGIFWFKDRIATQISLLWHEPYASFVAGLLYGYRGGLGSLSELFSITGVTHIVAISGYNITIISTIFISLATALYIPRKRAFYLVCGGVCVFVIFAGASASVVRAGIMGILVLIARQLGRTSSIANVLILTAVLMNIHNPFVLMWDAGFQLSFLATLGLVYISPVLSPYFEKIPGFFGLTESLVSTLSAIIITLPLILFQFGRLSVVAPFVNVAILWTIPWIMIAGAATVTVSFVFFPIARLLGFVAYIGMEYIIRIVTFFAHVSFASYDIRIEWWVMSIAYVVLFFSLRHFFKKNI